MNKADLVIIDYSDDDYYRYDNIERDEVGIILGFTGPIKSLTPAMANSAEIAFKEASESEDRDCYDEEMGSCLEAVCRCFAGEHLFHMLYNGRIDF